ncbi:MAG: GNAT family N-acetyltransferase [Bacilli bacterium]|jgi:tRNA(Ile)-lysidine synthase TilS/MesJ
MKAIRIILADIRKADKKFSLFHHGDRIAIGVSGGKDSLTLLYALHLYRKFSKVDFTIIPVTIDLGFDGFDATKIKEYCSTLNLELHVDDARFVYQVLKEKQGRDKHLPCAICSRMKKAAINKMAKELDCNKVAFAHHANDAIETLFMNEIFGSRIATFEPKMLLERAGIEFIRPLCLASEEDIIRCAKEERLPVLPIVCPADKKTSREDIKNMLKKLYKIYPFAQENFLTMLSNFEQESLWGKRIFYEIEGTDLSLKPVLSKEDAIDMMRIRVKEFVEKEGFSFDEEFDGSDSITNNFLILLKNQPIGAIRYIKVRANEYKISRFAILEEHQKHGYGSLVMKEIEAMLSREVNPLKLSLDAQDAYLSFYQKLGYEIKGDSFLEGKISHHKVEKYIEK